VALIAAGLSVAATSTNILTPAFAQKLPESGFGQAAKGLAQSSPGAMGDHAQDGSSFVGNPPFNDDGQPGREGIGNVAKQNDLNVGELGCVLGGLDC
jgi:hypothetical protein